MRCREDVWMCMCGSVCVVVVCVIIIIFFIINIIIIKTNKRSQDSTFVVT